MAEGSFKNRVKHFFLETTAGKITGGALLGGLAVLTGPIGLIAVSTVGAIVGGVMGYKKAAKTPGNKWYHRLGGALLGSWVGSILGSIGAVLGPIGAMAGCGAAVYFGEKTGTLVAPKQAKGAASPTKQPHEEELREIDRSEREREREPTVSSPERTPRTQKKRKQGRGLRE